MKRASSNPVGRRGFTLMETVLAASLGGLVVVVSLGVMGAIDRADQAATARFREADTLARLHLVMNRSFSNLVMAESSVSLRQSGSERERQRAREEGESGLRERAAIREGEAEVEPRPRVLLGADASRTLKDMLQSARHRGLISGGPGTVQRLEVVLSRSPVPPGFGRSSTQEVLMANAAAEDVVAVRGVFELRPDAATPPEALGGAMPGNDGWTLWWRPLPADAEGENAQVYEGDPTRDAAGVVIATGLVECTWTAFKAGERSPEFTALQYLDLPAYMEMSVRTARGVTANWMFEVGWSNGPETREELEEAAAARAEQNAAGGRGGPGGGPGGGQGGPGGRGGGGQDGAGGRGGGGRDGATGKGGPGGRGPGPATRGPGNNGNARPMSVPRPSTDAGGGQR